ncbi:MAG: N-acetylmuramoyl-L-alanine amidase [Pseudomonadota bacterium]
MLVLHYTGMQTAEDALERLTAPEAGVSAHYLIDRAGQLFRLVPETERAWHAGVSHWRGISDVNSASIGIELENKGHEFGPEPYPAAQMATLVALAGDIVTRHCIEARNVVGHSDIAPSRKQDPGEWFDWAALAAAGIGLWPAPRPSRGRILTTGDQGEDVERFQAALATYGYGLVADGRFGPVSRATVVAFQRHFRPQNVDGVADLETLDRLAGLLSMLD